MLNWYRFVLLFISLRRVFPTLVYTRYSIIDVYDTESHYLYRFVDGKVLWFFFYLRLSWGKTVVTLGCDFLKPASESNLKFVIQCTQWNPFTGDIRNIPGLYGFLLKEICVSPLYVTMSINSVLLELSWRYNVSVVTTDAILAYHMWVKL